MTGAVVLRGLGELDEQLVATLVAEAVALPRSVAIVLDLSELTLSRTPVLQSLLQELERAAGDVVHRAIVVCRRLSARRLVRHAAGPMPVPVVATLDDALLACKGTSETNPLRTLSSGADR